MYQIDFDHPLKTHFIGIGGISMSGLAEILLTEGFTVSGSDQTCSELTDYLKTLGVRINIGHRAENIDADTELVVYTAAIHEDNPEYKKAVELKIPLISRADILGQIMRNYGEAVCVAGTHGKTTTTGMISTVLMNNGENPTISIGGVLPQIGGSGNIRVGSNDYFVVESCEYTNSFLSFFPTVGIILNVAEDHLDFFKDLPDIRASFKRFAERVPEDGVLVIDKDIENHTYFTDGLKCQIITFGLDDRSADITAENIELDSELCGSYDLIRNKEKLGRVTLHVPGKHNVSNSLACFAACFAVGLSFDEIVKGISSFIGVKRRFEKKGTIHGVEIIDDYAHHPEEITATLSIVNAMKKGRLFCVFQSHTYTRTAKLFDEFVQALLPADEVILAPIYAARESNTIGITSASLAQAIDEKGGKAIYLETFGEIEDYILTHAVPGDIVLTMGAGDIYRVGEALAG